MNKKEIDLMSAAAEHGTLQDIARNLDDFEQRLANPQLDASSSEYLDDKTKLQNILKYAIALKSKANLSELPGEDNTKGTDLQSTESLNKLLESEKQKREAYGKELADIEKTIDILNKALKPVANVQKKMDNIQKDIKEHRKLFQDLIEKTFDHDSKKVMQLLNDLYKMYFSTDQHFVKIEECEYPTELIQTLLLYGIIETNPKNSSEIRLINFV